MARKDANDHDIVAIYGPEVVRILLAPTISTSAYAAGDVVGGLLTVQDERLKLAQDVAHRAYITRIFVADKSTQAQPLDVYVFNSQPSSAGNDNDAFDPADADLVLQAPGSPIHVTDWTTNTDNCQGRSGEVMVPIEPSASGVFYAYAVTRGTPTYTSTSDLTFVFEVTLL